MGVCILVLSLGLLALPATAGAAGKTIGPITTESGVTCHLSNSLVSSTTELGVPDLTYGSSWSCTGGPSSKPLSSDSTLSDELRERVAGATTSISNHFWQESCSDSYHCSQSTHHRRLPGATYTLTSRPTLRSFVSLNGTWDDDDFFNSWPASHCQAFTSLPFEPGPDTIRCAFSATL